jgi:hypothetical protein
MLARRLPADRQDKILELDGWHTLPAAGIDFREENRHVSGSFVLWPAGLEDLENPLAGSAGRSHHLCRSHPAAGGIAAEQLFLRRPSRGHALWIAAPNYATRASSSLRF